MKLTLTRDNGGYLNHANAGHKLANGSDET